MNNPILSKVTQITNNNNYDYNPQISGKNIIFQTFRSSTLDVFYNGDNGDTTTFRSGFSTIYPPSISGSNVVYSSEFRLLLPPAFLANKLGSFSNIYLFDGTSRKKLTNVGIDTRDVLSTYSSASISGNNVALSSSNYSPIIYSPINRDAEYKNSKLEILNLDTNERKTIKTITSRVGFGNVSISGNNVVWTEQDGNDSEIFLYNGKTTTQLTDNNVDDRFPSISGNNVVWSEQDGNDYKIFLYNGKTTTQLTDNAANPRASISGNNVVWSEQDGNDYEIFLHDGKTTIQLTDNNVDDRFPSISGNNIAWSQFDGNDFEIVTASLLVVNTTEDLPDADPNDGVIDVNLSKEGSQISLRSLIDYANKNPDFNQIKFAIPTSDPGYDSETETYTINISSSLPTLTITDPDIIIDGEEFIELRGNQSSTNPGLQIDADNTIVKGLTINNFGGSGIFLNKGNNSTIENNKIGTDVTGEIDRGNSLLGIFIQSSDNTIQDNVLSGNGNSGVGMTGNNSTNNQILSNFIGTNADGTKAIGNDQNGVSISDLGANVIEGNTIGSNGKLDDDDTFAGIGIDTATRNTIRNNWIGTNRDGSNQLGNKNWGIDIQNSSLNTINNVIEDNTIGNNGQAGIRLFNSSTNRIDNNNIGIDDSRSIDIGNIGNKGHGILITENSNNNKIGSRSTEENNWIFYNQESGVAIDSGTGNSINETLFFENGESPIDLGNDLVVNNNDSGDTDTGANNLQNSPSAILLSDETGYKINLNSTPNTNFYLEFFIEKGGQKVGGAEVTTDENGNAYYNFSGFTEFADKFYLTATNLTTNDTSEFSSLQKIEFDPQVNTDQNNKTIVGSEGKIIVGKEGQVKDFGLTRTGEFLSNQVSVDVKVANETELQQFTTTLASWLSTEFAATDTAFNNSLSKSLIAKVLEALKQGGLNNKYVNNIPKYASQFAKFLGPGFVAFDTIVGAIDQAYADNNTDDIEPIKFNPEEIEGTTKIRFATDDAFEGYQVALLKIEKDNERINTSSTFPLGIDFLQGTAIGVIEDKQQIDIVNFTPDDLKSLTLAFLGGAIKGAITGNPLVITGNAVLEGFIAWVGQIAKDAIQKEIVGRIIEFYGGDASIIGGKPSDILFDFNEIQVTNENKTLELPDAINNVTGNLAELNGTNISNFSSDDSLQIEGASLTEDNINITLGSAIIDIDENLDGIVDSTITLEGDFTNAEFIIEPVVLEDFSTTFISIEESIVTEVSISDVSLAEGTDGNTEFNFTVSLNETSTETITVDYATGDDSAVAGEDYTATNGTLEFALGDTEKTITVEVIGDSEAEENEAFLVNLSNASGGVIATPFGIGIIQNDDSNNSSIAVVNDTATTDEDTAVEIDILANDRNIDRNNLELSITDNPSNGNVLINNQDTPTDITDDTITYTPNPNFNGTETFIYKVSDGNGGEDTASVTVNVEPVNDNPVANDDTISTTENTTLTIPAIDLLSNDTDPDEDTLTIDSVSDAVNGKVELNDTDITFIPDVDFKGDASFTYAISDGNGGTDSATVSVTVTPDETEPNIINGTPGRDKIPGTEGDDIINGDQGRDVISTEDGNDVLVYNSIVDAGDIVTDFEVGKDKFDFSQLLNSFGYGGSAPFADGYVQVIANSSSSIITIDTDGAAGSGRARQFILVQNVAAEELDNPDNFKF